jgi:hypothetical protein
MATLDEAVKTQMRNIEESTGTSVEGWVTLIRASGREKHTEIVNWLKSEHGFSHGNANLVALTAKRSTSEIGDPVDAIYSGSKAALRPFHNRVIELINRFGSDVELAPKQAYVSARRAKQFGTVGPGPAGRLEIGLNLKGMEPTDRLESTSGMCTHRVRLASADELDAEVIGWLEEAYRRAGKPS